MRAAVKCGAALALLGALAPALPAQGIRITGVTTARYVDLLTFEHDSVSADSAEGEGPLRVARGVTVRCIPGQPFCRYVRSGDAAGMIPITQDMATAWGLGEGISAFAHLRGRLDAGADTDIWPQQNDEFDALAVYVEMDRERFRARLGRQWKSSGLGFYNFDGASVMLRATPIFSVDVFGGRSLVRGINEAHTAGAIASVEDIPPDEDAYVLGVEARARVRARGAIGVLYQREIATDRSQLYSERVSVDGTMRFLRQGQLDAELQADLATEAVNQARIRVTHPIARKLSGSLEYRHYVPFFELWTIWGAFSPIGYDEAAAAAYWGRDVDRLSLQLRGAVRRYQDTDEGLASEEMKNSGWRVSADGNVRLTSDWSTFGGVRTEIGFGASRTDGDLGLRWEPSRRGYLGVRASAWQSSYELRLGTGTVYGAGLDGGIRLRPDLRILGDVATYRHTYDDGAPSRDWSQMRGALRLEWTVGRDPGMQGGVR